MPEQQIWLDTRKFLIYLVMYMELHQNVEIASLEIMHWCYLYTFFYNLNDKTFAVFLGVGIESGRNSLIPSAKLYVYICFLLILIVKPFSAKYHVQKFMGSKFSDNFRLQRFMSSEHRNFSFFLPTKAASSLNFGHENITPVSEDDLFMYTQITLNRFLNRLYIYMSLNFIH